MLVIRGSIMLKLVFGYLGDLFEFRVLVLGPSLHNSNQEESLCSTAYLELFIRSVTSKSLLKCLLQFIVLHEHEGVPIMETLTQRLGNFNF